MKSEKLGQALNRLKTGRGVCDCWEKNPPQQLLKPPQKTQQGPANDANPGSHHPISLVRNEIVSIFKRMGFAVAQGPEMEDDWHNFSALNFPPGAPQLETCRTPFLGQKSGLGIENPHLQRASSQHGNPRATHSGHCARPSVQK